MKEPVIKQYLGSAAKSVICTGKDSFDLFLKAMNSYFSDQVNEELQAAEDIVVFADEATSNNRKEIVGVSVIYFSEKAKCFKLDFIGLFSVSSTKAEILLDKIKEVFTERNIDLLKTKFICFDGTNTMSGTKTGLQCRFQGEASYSVYVNCRCHRLALCFTHLCKREFPWLQKIDQLLLGLWKMFHYSSKNCHVLAELQKAYDVKSLQMVKAATTR